MLDVYATGHMNKMDRLLLAVQIEGMVREGIILKIPFQWQTVFERQKWGRRIFHAGWITGLKMWNESIESGWVWLKDRILMGTNVRKSKALIGCLFL